MRKVPLTNSKKFVIVDSDDYRRTDSREWFLDHYGYVRATDPPQEKIEHFLKGNPPKGLQWDHEDRNPLNNRKRNLRLSTPSQNSCNRGLRRDNKSGFKGVFWRGKKWIAYIKIRGKRIHLGTFEDRIKAAMTYDKAARKLHGKFAVLNIRRFPRN